jgi:hypothetical protein
MSPASNAGPASGCPERATITVAPDHARQAPRRGEAARDARSPAARHRPPGELPSRTDRRRPGGAAARRGGTGRGVPRRGRPRGPAGPAKARGAGGAREARRAEGSADLPRSPVSPTVSPRCVAGAEAARSESRLAPRGSYRGADQHQHATSAYRREPVTARPPDLKAADQPGNVGQVAPSGPETVCEVCARSLRTQQRAKVDAKPPSRAFVPADGFPLVRQMDSSSQHICLPGSSPSVGSPGASRRVAI